MGKQKEKNVASRESMTPPALNREEEVKYWEKVWPSVQKSASESEYNIDKKVFALSAGAIGLELTLLELVGEKNPGWNWLAFVAAGFLVLALILNLINHLYGRRTQNQQSKMIKDFIYEDRKALTTSEIYSKMEKQSTRILLVHWASAIAVILGILFLFSYSFIQLS